MNIHVNSWSELNSSCKLQCCTRVLVQLCCMRSSVRSAFVNWKIRCRERGAHERQFLNFSYCAHAYWNDKHVDGFERRIMRRWEVHEQNCRFSSRFERSWHTRSHTHFLPLDTVNWTQLYDAGKLDSKLFSFLFFWNWFEWQLSSSHKPAVKVSNLKSNF